ncbi:MAG: sulfatase-like hydrolase/transferase [Muribaculaceae bacterium]|nr:sulfatase-like hydrolase/transferase [Muribaculaceae bacterium]
MGILKSINKKGTDGEYFLTILFISLFLLFLDFGLSLHLSHISLPFKISSALADSCVIVILCMFLKGKWRIIWVAAAFLIGIILYVNLLYHRNFEDILQASSYLNADLRDPAITDGALSSFKMSDVTFFILPLCPLGYLLWRRGSALYSQIGDVYKYVAFALCLMSWCVSYAGVFRRTSLWNPNESFKKVTSVIFSTESDTWCRTYEMHNFTGYTVRCILSCFNIGMDLTPSDIEGIKHHLAGKADNLRIPTDQSTSARKKKNLIMIIVESLPYKVIEKPEAATLMPTIMTVYNDSSTIVSKCRILADYGRSSDAQFIYNTGLLPLKHEALVDNYAYNDYPSIAKALSKPSMEIIGESKGLWLHSLTTKSYGFDMLIDNIAPTGQDQDSIIFNRAEMEISRLESPFFLFITTITMHDPYDERKVTDEASYTLLKTDDERDYEYYARLHHFDKSLGKFLLALKGKGIYDDSVIVILGDHEIRASKISASLHDDHVPFIIINSPLNCRSGLPTTQLDVFPTILDMMGCEYKYLGVEYTGLGQSVFSTEARSGSYYKPTDKDFQVSEMIIKGRPSAKRHHIQ